MQMEIKNKKKRFWIYIARAVVLIIAGFLTESSTSYFSDLVNSKLPDIVIVIVMVVIMCVYFIIASQLRPVRSLDNDLWGPAAVLVVLFASFVDNMTAGWISSLLPLNLTGAIICLLLSILTIAIDIFVIDKQYEKFSDDAEEIFCVRVKSSKEVTANQQEQKAYNGKENFAYQQAQRAYKLKIAKTWIISIVFVVLAIVVGALWATYGLTWEV